MSSRGNSSASKFASLTSSSGPPRLLRGQTFPPLSLIFSFVFVCFPFFLFGFLSFILRWPASSIPPCASRRRRGSTTLVDATRVPPINKSLPHVYPLAVQTFLLPLFCFVSFPPSTSLLRDPFRESWLPASWLLPRNPPPPPHAPPPSKSRVLPGNVAYPIAYIKLSLSFKPWPHSLRGEGGAGSLSPYYSFFFLFFRTHDSLHSISVARYLRCVRQTTI